MVEIEIDVFDPQCTGQRRGDLEKLKYEITGKKRGGTGIELLPTGNPRLKI
jgi:hypothetical protein